MSDRFKTTIEKARHQLEDIIDKIEGQFEALSEDSATLWQQAKPKLQALKQTLNAAISSLQTQTDKAQLQSHLAMMDAHDQWTYLNHTVSALSQQLKRTGKAELEHADLMAHLAGMELRDFMNGKGGEISRDFKTARNKVEQLSYHAAQELEKSLANIGKGLKGPL